MDDGTATRSQGTLRSRRPSKRPACSGPVSLCQVTGSELSEVITSAEVPFGKLAMSRVEGQLTHRQPTAIYAIVGVPCCLCFRGGRAESDGSALRNQRRPACGSNLRARPRPQSRARAWKRSGGARLVSSRFWDDCALSPGSDP